MNDSQKKIVELKNQLQSTKVTEVIAAIKEVGKNGSMEVVPDLIRATFGSGFVNAEEEGKKVLFNIKKPEMVDVVLQILNENPFPNHKSTIASILWEAGLNAEDRLIELVEMAVESDYMTIVEITTVIENIETGFPYDEVSEASLIINEHIQEEEDENRIALLSSLAQTLNGMAAE